jgi:myosin heavy subunit
VVENFNQIRDEYIKEAVDLFDFKLIDNLETLHILESQHGLIKTLNKECMLPKGNDESFVYKVKKAHTYSAKLISQKLHHGYEFGVAHFAGSVHYDGRRFVQTNMDKLPDGLLECAAKSTNSLIQHEFQKLLSMIRDADSPPPVSSSISRHRQNLRDQARPNLRDQEERSLRILFLGRH